MKLGTSSSGGAATEAALANAESSRFVFCSNPRHTMTLFWHMRREHQSSFFLATCAESEMRHFKRSLGRTSDRRPKCVTSPRPRATLGTGNGRRGRSVTIFNCPVITRLPRIGRLCLITPLYPTVKEELVGAEIPSSDSSAPQVTGTRRPKERWLSVGTESYRSSDCFGQRRLLWSGRLLE